MGRRRKNKYEGIAGLFSFVRPLFTIVILSAFVLGIAFGVKYMVTSQTSFLKIATPVLVRLGIDAHVLGDVAGAFSERLSKTGINGGISLDSDISGAFTARDGNNDGSTDNNIRSTTEDLPKKSDIDSTRNTTRNSNSETLLKVAIMGDSHSNYTNLDKALIDAQSRNLLAIFFLGDYTQLGVLDDLSQAKALMDTSKIPYYSLPGDHDLWKSTGPDNFMSVFGQNYFSKEINGYKFVGLDNSANYTLISEERLEWFRAQLADADFVLLSQPIYHPSNYIYMGYVDGQLTQNVYDQGQYLLEIIRKSDVKAVIAGDQHFSNNNPDPVDSGLQHFVVGALVDERNLQSPRYSEFRVFTDGSFEIEDVLIK